jgi:hypothetical protein
MATAMTLGSSAIRSYSRKWKINTKSSTKMELMGVGNAITNILWSLYILKEQGCGITHAIT